MHSNKEIIDRIIVMEEQQLTDNSFTDSIYATFDYSSIPRVRNSAQIPRLLSQILSPVNFRIKTTQNKCFSPCEKFSKCKFNQTGYLKRQLREDERKKVVRYLFRNFKHYCQTGHRFLENLRAARSETSEAASGKPGRPTGLSRSSS